MKKIVLVLLALFSFAIFDNVKAETSCFYDSNGSPANSTSDYYYYISNNEIIINGTTISFLNDGEVHGNSEYDKVKFEFDIEDGCPANLYIEKKDKTLYLKKGKADTIPQGASVVKTCKYTIKSKEYKINFYSTGESIVYINNKQMEGCSDVKFNLSADDNCPDKIYLNYEYTCSIFDIKKASSSYEGSMTKKVTCGNITNIPRKFPELTSYVVTLVQIAIPIVLVIMGSIDLVKGIAAQKEDEIKKGYQMLIKRIIIGALIFFVVIIVKFIISLVADASTANIVECIDCFISNDCD